MKSTSGFLLIFLFVLITFKIAAQNPRIIDSLNSRLKETKANDTTRALILMSLSDEYFTNEPVLSLANCNKALEIAEKNIQTATGKEKDKYAEIIFTIYNNTGYLYKIHGDIKKATDNYFKALTLAEINGNYNGVASVASNIGILYRANGDLEKAFEFYKKGLDAAIRSDNKAQIAQGYINFGRYYNSKKDTALAMRYYRMALNIDLQLKNNAAIALLYNNIGFVYFNSQDYSRATDYFKKSLELKIQANDIPDIVMAYNNLGKVYLNIGQTDSAYYYYSSAENLQKKNKFPEYYGPTLNGLYQTYKKKGNTERALYYFEQFKIFSDTIFNATNKEQLTKKEMQYDFEKKEAILKAEQEKKEVLSQAESRKQKIVLWCVCGILLLVIIFAIYIYRNFKEKQKINSQLEGKNELIQQQKAIVEEKQKEILDSILYAEQIQKTLIANHDFVNQTIPDSFVVFKPKDIVSGDFYWASTVGSLESGDRSGSKKSSYDLPTSNSELTANSELFFIAVCDSTGHGVPGAFMSLLNISFLNEAIKEKNITDPALVFEHVRIRLIESISQSGRKDGMDGTIVCFDKISGTITYCAANNSPVLISGTTLTQLPSDKMPVGKGEKIQSFATHTIPAKKGDMLYLFTDGYPDQFGGPRGKKFKYKQLEELFVSISAKAVAEQAKLLNDRFEEWKGELEQIDDVCIVGIRI